MPENGKQNVPTVQPQGQNFIQFECPECRKPIAARIPITSIFNSLTVSVLTFTHERFDRCMSCGATYIAQVKGIDPANGSVAFAWMKVELESKIVPPTQQNLSAAIDMDNLTKGMKKQ